MAVWAADNSSRKIPISDREYSDKPFCVMHQAWAGVMGDRIWHLLRGDEIPELVTARKSLGYRHVLPPVSRQVNRARPVRASCCTTPVNVSTQSACLPGRSPSILPCLPQGVSHGLDTTPRMPTPQSSQSAAGSTQKNVARNNSTTDVEKHKCLDATLDKM